MVGTIQYLISKLELDRWTTKFEKQLLEHNDAMIKMKLAHEEYATKRKELLSKEDIYKMKYQISNIVLTTHTIQKVNEISLSARSSANLRATRLVIPSGRIEVNVAHLVGEAQTALKNHSGCCIHVFTRML